MKKILVVGSPGTLRALIQIRLQKEGFNVVCFTDGDSALSRVETSDALVVDSRWGTLKDGSNLAEVVRRQKSVMPILEMADADMSLDIVCSWVLGVTK